MASGEAVHAPSELTSGSCTSICKHANHPLAAVGNELGAVFIVRTDLAQITAVLNVNKGTLVPEQMPISAVQRWLC